MPVFMVSTQANRESLDIVPVPSRRLRSIRIGVIFAIISFIVYSGLQSFYANHYYSGDYSSSLLISNIYGVPECEAAIGIEPGGFATGWDGQFYYHLSNDPFLIHDAKDHMDSAPYRAQRIGLPLIAYLVGKLAGEDLVTPWLYFTVNWASVAIGLGALAGWLYYHRVHPAYALIWGTWAGMINAGMHGLPDAVGDALFILAVITIEAGFLGWYALFASLLLLTREGYAAYAGMVFLFTLLGWVRWPAGYSRWRKYLYTAFPGILMLSWALYLAIHLHTELLFARKIPGLTDLPFAAFCRWTLLQYQQNIAFEVRWKIVCASLLVLVFILILLNARKRPALAASCVYLVLTSMLGDIIWETYAGYMKAVGTVLIVAIFLLPTSRSWLFRLCFIPMIWISLQMMDRTMRILPYKFAPGVIQSTKPLDAPLPDVPAMEILKDVRGEFTWLNPFETLELKPSIWNRYHREVKLFHVRVTNRSNEIWTPNPVNQARSLRIDIRMLDAKTRRMRDFERLNLPKVLHPGESCEVIIPVFLKRGRQIVAISMVQEEVHYFLDRDPTSGSTYQIEVK
jgi:hypothetical protein